MAASTLPPLPAHPTVSAVIPARHAAATLEKAVLSTLAQGPAVGEVVIAVGDPDTARVAAQLASRYPRVRIVDNPHGGTSSALNAAIAAGTGQVIVRVDAHAVLPENYVVTALEALRATGAANVGGRQVAAADRGFARAVALAMGSTAGSGGAAYRTGTQRGPADTVYLGVFRREALEHVGGYDEQFVRNQDAELNERLRAHGHVVWFEPALEVAYRPRGSVRALARQYAAYGRWRRATARRHPGSLRPRQLAAPALVIALVVLGLVSVIAASPWPFGVAAGGYALALVVAGVAAAGRPVVGLQVALALLTMHLSWGVGFLAGPPQTGGGRAPKAAGPSSGAQSDTAQSDTATRDAGPSEPPSQPPSKP